MDNKPLTSLIIITKDRAEDVSLLVKDLTDQTYNNHEIILIDNASEQPLSNEVIGDNPKVKFFRSQKNLGVSGGRNKGIKESSGEILIFIDDDSRIEDIQLIEKIVTHFTEDEHLAILTYKIIDEKSRNVLRQTIPRRDKKELNYQYQCAYFMGGGFACRSSLFEEYGNFEESYFYSGEELDFSFRITPSRPKILFTPDIVVVHKTSPQGRPHGQRYFFLIRNRLLIAAKFLPWPYAVTHMTLWLLFIGYESIINLMLISFLKGVLSALKEIPGVLKKRRPLSYKDIRWLNKLSGRTYF